MQVAVSGVTAAGEPFAVELEIDTLPAQGALVDHEGALYVVVDRMEDYGAGGGSCRLRPARDEDLIPPAMDYLPVDWDGSRILLPLRTSVDLFSDPGQPSALTRAKQAAALHDIVVVEVGFFDVSLTEHGGSTWWTPPQGITADDIARARKPPEVGQPMSLAIGDQPAIGVPADRMQAVVSGPIAMSYGAEWHSEVLDPLDALGVDFVELVATPGGDLSTLHPIGKAISQQNFRDRSDRSLMAHVNTFRRDFIYKSFNRDVAVAQDLGAVVQVSTLFEPMLQHRGRQPSGTTALEIAAPNLSSLEWEQVLEFRQHPGAEEARHMLREFERLALEEGPRDAEEFLMKVSQQVTDGLLGALKDREVHLGRAVAEEAAKTGVSMIPFVGPFIEKGITAVEIGAAKLAESRSGLAALMKLRKQ